MVRLCALKLNHIFSGETGGKSPRFLNKQMFAEFTELFSMYRYIGRQHFTSSLSALQISSLTTDVASLLSQHFLSEKRVAEVKGERHSELKIVGIDQSQRINDEAPILSFVPNVEMTISEYVKKIRTLFDDISARKLEKRVELPDGISKITSAFNSPVEISEREQKIICSVADQLGINITKDFFVLGNLSQSSIPTGIMGGYSLNGTDAEEEKYDAIQELLETISNALKWAHVEKAFTDKKCLKLALQNCGTDIDEDIEISLTIPKSSLLPIDEFPKFNNDEMGYLLNDCNMSEIFGICSTSTYRITCTATRKRVKRITPNAIQPFGAQLTGICFPAESLMLKLFFFPR